MSNFCAVSFNFDKNLKCIVLNFTTYRPPNGVPNELEHHFENILSKREITNKKLVLVRDFNINVLDFNEGKMVNYRKEINAYDKEESLCD